MRSNDCWVSIFCLLLSSCALTPDEQIRGTDREAFLPSVRVRSALGAVSKAEAEVGEQEWKVASEWEAGYERVDGEFAQASGATKYHSRLAHVAFAPRLEMESTRLAAEGFAGLAYGDIDVTAPTNDSKQNDVGSYIGIGLRYRGLGVVEPYARVTNASSVEWSIGVVEVGFEAKPAEFLGIEVAYASQTSRIETENSDGGARIETDGLRIGMVLRF